jgi:hypothetical protein
MDAIVARLNQNSLCFCEGGWCGTRDHGLQKKKKINFAALHEVVAIT